MLDKNKTTSALIGYTGFVGGNILSQKKFNDLYNTQNISSIKNKSYDVVVCAGTRASKWLINQNPENDKKEILCLLNNLETVKTRQFVLISTIDIYPKPNGVDEDYLPSIKDHKLAYGKHRLELEQSVKKLFANTLILRLPALFGEGIKKNFVYDMIYDKTLDWTNLSSEFQFYNLRNIWQDILFGLHSKLEYLNISSEPIKAGEIMKQLGKKIHATAKNLPVYYDFRSKHTNLRAITDGYFYHKSQIIPELLDFITNEKEKLK